MNGIDRSYTPLKAADGGYLSFAIGCDPRFQINFSPMLYREYIVCMDSELSMRRNLFHDYKIHRAERRELDPVKEERYRRVQEFKLTLWQDPYLNCWDYPGLESDDLVALLAWKNHNLDLLGVDKDLFQLGSHITRMYKIGGELSRIDSFFNRLPKGIQDIEHTPENILFILTLLGDKSDDVPRLVPPYSIPIFHGLLHSEKKWDNAYYEYGNNFLLNLYLVTLPFPGLFGIQPLELLHLVSSGEWRPDHYLWSRLEMFHFKLYQEIKKHCMIS